MRQDMDNNSLLEFLKNNLRIEILHRPFGENYISIELQVRDVLETGWTEWHTISEDRFPLD